MDFIEQYIERIFECLLILNLYSMAEVKIRALKKLFMYTLCLEHKRIKLYFTVATQNILTMVEF